MLMLSISETPIVLQRCYNFVLLLLESIQGVSKNEHSAWLFKKKKIVFLQLNSVIFYFLGYFLEMYTLNRDEDFEVEANVREMQFITHSQTPAL